MDALDPKPETDRIQNVPKQKHSIGFIERPHLGMMLFEVDKGTGKAELVKYKTSSLPHKRIPKNKKALVVQNAIIQTVVNHEVIVDPSKWQVWAINKKNAERKFQKMLKEERNRRGNA